MMVPSAVLLLLLSLAVTYITAAPNWDPAAAAEEFSLRGAPKATDTDDDLYYRRSRARGKDDFSRDSRARNQGIGSLLLKNLRFRDLSDMEKPQSLNALLLGGYPAALSHAEALHGVDKRQSINVSQLARLLNNLKARNVDDDSVKLQNLRFGKK